MAYRNKREEVSITEWIRNYFGPALDGSIYVIELKIAMEADGVIFDSEDEFFDTLVALCGLDGFLKLLFLVPNPPLARDKAGFYAMKVTRKNQP